MANPKTVLTTLKKDKDCTSCKRYRSSNPEDKVTTSIYLRNDSYEKLGNPEEIVVEVKAK